jgi:hypothetical protein
MKCLMALQGVLILATVVYKRKQQSADRTLYSARIRLNVSAINNHRQDSLPMIQRTGAFFTTVSQV